MPTQKYNPNASPVSLSIRPPVCISQPIARTPSGFAGLDDGVAMAAAVALVRPPWAARVLGAATARLVDNSLATGLLVFNPVVVADPDGDEKCDEEEYDVHDSQREARLEHGAALVDVKRQRIIEIRTNFSEWT